MADAEPPREEPAVEISSSDAASAAGVDAAEPKKRGKKRAKPKPEPKLLPGAGTPDGDKLREAVRAFEVGDYARVRARVADLRESEDLAIREVAADLATRIDVDPVQVVVILACAAVLGALAYVWVF